MSIPFPGQQQQLYKVSTKGHILGKGDGELTNIEGATTINALLSTQCLVYKLFLVDADSQSTGIHFSQPRTTTLIPFERIQFNAKTNSRNAESHTFSSPSSISRLQMLLLLCPIRSPPFLHRRENHCPNQQNATGASATLFSTGETNGEETLIYDAMESHRSLKKLLNP